MNRRSSYWKALVLNSPPLNVASIRTWTWRGFKFTPTGMVAGKYTKWEATCYHESHRDKVCRRTLTFHTEEDEQLTLRRLKHWCLSGHACASRQEHRGLPLYPEPLPALAELDAA